MDLDTLRQGRRLVVLSPHLDDGVLSLGATIANLTRRRIDVSVVTAFAGDPDAERPAGWWDRLAGFATAADAVRARREEDREACAAVGATPVWLPFLDGQYEQPRATPTFIADLDAACRGADAVMIPGFPLEHADHAWLTSFALGHGLGGARIGLYVEQPYMWRRGGRPGLADAVASALATLPNWYAPRVTRLDRRAKRRALNAYRSQERLLGKFTFPRLAFDEHRRGGESIAWLDTSRLDRRPSLECEAGPTSRSA